MTRPRCLVHRGGGWLRSLVCRLHRIRDVEHAHSPGSDVGILGCRRGPGHGLRLVVLGDGTADSKAAPQRRSRRIADSASHAASIAQFLVADVGVGAGSVFPTRLHAVVAWGRVRLGGWDELQLQTAGGPRNDRRAAHRGRILARVAAGVGKLLGSLLSPHRLRAKPCTHNLVGVTRPRETSLQPSGAPDRALVRRRDTASASGTSACDPSRSRKAPGHSSSRARRR
jgi:hypothetical protein